MATATAAGRRTTTSRVRSTVDRPATPVAPVVPADLTAEGMRTLLDEKLDEKLSPVVVTVRQHSTRLTAIEDNLEVMNHRIRMLSGDNLGGGRLRLLAALVVFVVVLVVNSLSSHGFHPSRHGYHPFWWAVVAGLVTFAVIGLIQLRLYRTPASGTPSDVVHS